MYNRLWGTRSYLIGGIDRVEDSGVIWRDILTPKLEKLGVVVLNPCEKPIDLGNEGPDAIARRRQMIKDGKYDEVAREVRLLRVIDLRMVDLSDFLICYLDPKSHLCGTYEELFTANSTKKPILVMVEGGKHEVPLWLLGTLPHQQIFGSWEDLLGYIHHVDEDEEVDHLKRWTWFQYDEMLPQNVEVLSKEFFL